MVRNNFFISVIQFYWRTCNCNLNIISTCHEESIQRKLAKKVPKTKTKAFKEIWPKRKATNNRVMGDLVIRVSVLVKNVSIRCTGKELEYIIYIYIYKFFFQVQANAKEIRDNRVIVCVSVNINSKKFILDDINS